MKTVVDRIGSLKLLKANASTKVNNLKPLKTNCRLNAIPVPLNESINQYIHLVQPLTMLTGRIICVTL